MFEEIRTTITRLLDNRSLSNAVISERTGIGESLIRNIRASGDVTRIKMHVAEQLYNLQKEIESADRIERRAIHDVGLFHREQVIRQDFHAVHGCGKTGHRSFVWSHIVEGESDGVGTLYMVEPMKARTIEIKDRDDHTIAEVIRCSVPLRNEIIYFTDVEDAIAYVEKKLIVIDVRQKLKEIRKGK